MDKAENGTVALSGSSAAEGDEVTVTVKADEGYKLDVLTVLDKNGKSIEVTKKSQTEYVFTMPAGKVVVKAAFIKWDNPFVNMTEADYYYDAVLWAVGNGITGGTSATTFSPGAVCTRAQMIMFLWRVAGSDYYHDAVRWAAEKGITAGTGESTFSPGNPCLRGQIITFLYRYVKG